MKKAKLTFKTVTLVFALVMIAGFAVTLSYALPPQGEPLRTPEPGTLVLISTGLFGGLLRFARRRFREFKRAFDVLISAIGLVTAFPVVVLTGLYIKIVSPGPVFFTQKRLGKNGNPFTIYKMRTMRLDAEKDTGAVWAQENDPRLIRFGKYIRKMHLDEIPQLFNVLKGEMSVIGPRPERPEIVVNLKKIIPEYEKRLNVKPGITGLAQVFHKYDETIEDVKKKIKFDLLYVRKMCLLVDLRILAKTLVVVVTGRGAR